MLFFEDKSKDDGCEISGLPVSGCFCVIEKIEKIEGILCGFIPEKYVKPARKRVC